jgi:Fe2+ or Zn2+ uptake regulation protein
LANPEQKLLNLLISESEPLTYAKVSQLTGHSINTVRVNMNSLKKKGFVEESTLPSGVKLFSVTNKEKIKKIYNVQVL